MQTAFAVKGNLFYTPVCGKLARHPGAYLVCENGTVAGIFDTLPDRYQGIPVEDYGDKLILPGLVDLHVHGGQYAYRGLGMDMELLDWLEEERLPGGEPLCRGRLRRGGLPHFCGRTAAQCHHPGQHFCHAAPSSHAAAHGDAGKGRAALLCGQGQHGPQQPRLPAGIHRGSPWPRPALAGGRARILPLCVPF